MSTPQLAAFLPVEDALVSIGLPDRRTSLYRIFNDLYAPEFPANVRLTVAMVLLGGSGDFAVEVVLRDYLQREVVRARGTVTARDLHAHFFNLVFQLESPGDYQLEGFIEEQLVARVPILARQLQPAAPPVLESAA